MSRLQRSLLINSAVVLAVALAAGGAGAQSTAVPTMVGSASESVAVKAKAQKADAPRQAAPHDVAKSVRKPELRTKSGAKVTPAPTRAVTSAAPVPTVSGSLQFSGMGGDYISGDRHRSYSHPAASVAIFGSGARVTIAVASGDDWWDTTLQAPNNVALAVGKYEGAARYPFNGPSLPGLSIYGTGRGCNTLTGWFEIHQIRFGADNVIEAIDATFEQHCEGGPSFAFGHLLVNATALAHTSPSVSFEAAAQATVELRANHSGILTKSSVSGQISCTSPAKLAVTGGLSQTVGGGVVAPPVQTSLRLCTPETDIDWHADGMTTLPLAFQTGTAQAKIVVNIHDPYGMPTPVTLTAPTTVVVQSATTKVAATSASLRLGGDYSRLNKMGHSFASPGNQMEIWSDGTYLYVGATGADGKKWSVHLATAGTGKLAVGTYTGVKRFDTVSLQNNATAPSMSLLAKDDDCWYGVSGSFVVHQIAYNPDGSLSGIDASFEQRCGAEAATAFGHVLVNMTPLHAVTQMSGDAYAFVGFSKRTSYGMNNGGSLYGDLMCSNAVKLNATGEVTQGDAKIPLKLTFDCVPGEDGMELRIFGTELSDYGLTDSDGVATLTLVPVEPYLTAYRITISAEVFIFI